MDEICRKCKRFIPQVIFINKTVDLCKNASAIIRWESFNETEVRNLARGCELPDNLLAYYINPVNHTPLDCDFKMEKNVIESSL